MSSCHLLISPAVEVSLTLARQTVTRRPAFIVSQLTELWLSRLSSGTGLNSFCPVLCPYPHLAWRPWVPGGGKTVGEHKCGPSLGSCPCCSCWCNPSSTYPRKVSGTLLSPWPPPQGPQGPASCSLDMADTLGAFEGQAAQRPATTQRPRLGPG